MPDLPLDSEATAVADAKHEPDDYFKYFQEQPGSEPGTLSIDPDAPPSQIALIDYNSHQLAQTSEMEAESFSSYFHADSVSWLDVQGLGSEDILLTIGELCHLHPLLLEDVVNVPQRPKVQDYNEHLLVVMRMVMPHPDHDGFRSEQISFVLGDRYLLTFQEEPLDDCFTAVRQRICENRGKVRQLGPDYLTYLLVDAALDGYFPVLEAYGDRLGDLEEEVTHNPSRHTIKKIYQLRRELLALRRALWPQRSAINILSSDRSPLIDRDVQIYFRDCYDRLIQLLDLVETYRELAASLMDVYMSAMSNKVNEIVSLLTIVSSIFIPLTFIVGVYGMNFEQMPGLSWRWGYWACCGVMLLVAGSMLTFFWRRGWFAVFSFVNRD
ncbi:MAG: magnesium/cobalt transporter CorA [Spirulinaceae cyanobacterium RM2_2_10]|nr:magnesium/cobalt transporter CorA [Spirulinaceae cyanobacterium SM2_1_0]NJO19195.1 magnesium/cobalt transporter CorA [Spirulinaceae cyanobacterium RM2_2_10]